MSTENKKHIVYQAKIDSEIVYIGSGARGREKHCNSGCSHVYEMNRLHFLGVEIKVTITHYGLSKEESLSVEKELIIKHQPKYNTNHISSVVTIKMSLGSEVNRLLKNSFKSLYGELQYEKYKGAISDIISMLGITNLFNGYNLPNDRYGRKTLLTPAARTLYYNIRFKNYSAKCAEWLSTVFEYTKEGSNIHLKIKSDIAEKYIT